MKTTRQFELKIELSVLEDLGINLYSNVPAVLSEVVANAWDADATKVDIDVDTTSQTITIVDDGKGMCGDELQGKYLTVGYKRRMHGEILTPLFKRPVMGRKGIGKLSLFSIAEDVSVFTRGANDKDIEESAIQLDIKAIKEHITADPNKPFQPLSIQYEHFTDKTGTKIVLSKIKKSLARLESDLRKRLARRFSILGDNFEVKINGKAITPQDRGYYGQIQYVWLIGEGKALKPFFTNAEKVEEVAGVIDGGTGREISGWIGTFKSQKPIEDGEDNTVAILARGKLIHEDILKNLKEGGVFTKYLTGDVSADFVDENGKEDMATSDRQSLKEDDDRFIALRDFIQQKILKDIKRKWTDWRTEKSAEEAMENEAIKKWYDSLDGKDLQKYAKKLFGLVGSFNFDDDPERKKELYKVGVLAFERLAHQKALTEIDDIKDEEGFMALKGLFTTLDDIEASMYYSIAQSRVEVLKKLQSLVDANAKEKVIQAHIYDHLWLLSPSWERATENARVEEKVTTEFKKITAKLTKEERDGRLDIRYKATSGKHVIIELKKYSVKIDVFTLGKQIAKYKSALEKCLKDQFSEDHPNIEVICILGTPPTHPSGNKSAEDILRADNARYITYDTLIKDALESYKSFLETSKEASRIQKIIEEI